MRVLSVDLGTSNTVAVLSAQGRAPTVLELDGSVTMPSAVFAAADGTLVVGREAIRRARTDPARFEPNPKRRIDEGTLLLGDRVVPVTEALSAVLGRVSAEVTRLLGGALPDEVRLTHPAQWGPVRRNTLLTAARQAGLPHNLMLIPEPVAAAAHFASFPGQSLPPGKALVVYDLGAGTFDVGIVAAQQQGFAVLAEAGMPDFGGVDVDHALLVHVGHQVAGRDPAGWQRLVRPDSMDERRAARLLREDIRAAKEALSSHPQTEVALPQPFGDTLVARVELESAIGPKVVESVRLLAATMNSAGLTPANLMGVYLVGGSSRIPLVAQQLTAQLRIVPTRLDAPETAVALGAHLLPRAGAGMRTDVVLPAAAPSTPSKPSIPQAAASHIPQHFASGSLQSSQAVRQQQAMPQQFAHQQPQLPSAPSRRSRKRLLAAAFVLVVVAGLAVAWIGTRQGEPQARPKPPVKYDPVKSPACADLTGAVSGFDLVEHAESDSRSGSFGGFSCRFETKAGASYASVSIEVKLYPRNFSGLPGAEAANEEYDKSGPAGNPHPLNLGYVRKAEHLSFPPTCSMVNILAVDDNAFLQVRYGNTTQGMAADTCAQNAQDLLKAAYDVTAKAV